VCSESGLPDDLSWGRLGYTGWLDTAQDLCHSKATHPLDHTDFTFSMTFLCFLQVRCRTVHVLGRANRVLLCKTSSDPSLLANTAVLPKLPHCNGSKSIPKRPLWGRRGRLGTLVQQLECGMFGTTAVYAFFCDSSCQLQSLFHD